MISQDGCIPVSTVFLQKQEVSLALTYATVISSSIGVKLDPILYIIEILIQVEICSTREEK